MSRLIVLDSGVLSLLTHPHPMTNPESQACTAWLQRLRAAGDVFIIPEVTDYEVRREYLRRNSVTALRNLDLLVALLRFIPFASSGWRRAAELWAWARSHGHITAPATDLNIDLLLAAQAQLLAVPGVDVVIATTNVRHLAPFAAAQLWTAI